jgi:DNA transformation protein
MLRGNAFFDFLTDQLSAIDDLSAKRMFGGVGFYSGDLFFAIMHDEVVYFKVDDMNRGDYVRAGTKPFKPYSDRPMTMQYYEVPVAVLEDADELCRWARAAIAAAARKPPVRKRKNTR